jgi:hypothetical protein
VYFKKKRKEKKKKKGEGEKRKKKNRTCIMHPQIFLVEMSKLTFFG